MIGILVGLLGGLAKEVFDQRRAVMLLDEVDQRLRQAMLLGQVDAILDVADDDQGAHGRREVFVPALGADRHVLNKVVRFQHLPDVMKIGPDPA